MTLSEFVFWLQFVLGRDVTGDLDDDGDEDGEEDDDDDEDDDDEDEDDEGEVSCSVFVILFSHHLKVACYLLVTLSWAFWKK